MGRADYLSLGSWNVVCFRCGRKRKASEMRKQWQGYWVCSEHWEPRQPQDFVKGVPDQMAPPWVQPPGQDVFALFCTPEGMTAIGGYGVAGCMIAGYISPAWVPFFNGELEPDPCEAPQCTTHTRSAFAGYGAAGCLITGNTNLVEPIFLPLPIPC